MDLAWRALEDHARRTINVLVRLALAGQLLPGGVLALEILEGGTGAGPAGLSPLLAGCSASDCNVQDNEVGVTAAMTERGADSDLMAQRTPSATSRTTSRVEEAEGAELISQKETLGDVDDGLFNGLGFGEETELERA